MSRDPIQRPWEFRSPIEVREVDATGPAYEVLLPGDRLVAVDGLPVTSLEGAARLARLGPGQRVMLSVEREGRRFDTPLTTSAACFEDSRLWGVAAPALPSQVATESSRTPGADGAVPLLPDLYPRGWLGFALACRQCGWAREAGDDAPYWESIRQPAIHAVEPGSPAARAGLAVGDTLTHVNGRAITTRAGGTELGAVRPGDRILLRVRRGTNIRSLRLVATGWPVRPGVAPLRYEGRIGGIRVQVRGPVPVDVTRAAEGAVILRVGESSIILQPKPAP